MNDTLSIARSGMQSAELRMRNSAHNVANLVTEDFHNHRTVQVSRAGGGSSAFTKVDDEPQPVSVAKEVVEQAKASYQFKASARVIEADLDMKGALLDAFA